MDYHVSLTENKKHLICVVTGKFSADQAKLFAEEAGKLALETGCRRLLFDVRNARNTSDIFQNYDFAFDAGDHLIHQSDTRTAILVSPEDDSHDFMETVMSRAGYTTRVF